MALARALRAPRIPELPRLTGGLMGYVAYEAAELLDGHPVPDPATAPCPPIGLLVIDRAVVFDHWRQRLLLVAHVAARRATTRASTRSRSWPRTVGRGARAAARVGDRGAAADARRAEHARRALPRDRPVVQGAHPGRRHLPGRAVAPGRRSRRPTAGYPIYRRLRVTNPAPYMFFVRMLGLELAGSSPEPLVRVRGPAASRPGRSPARGRAARPRSRDRLLEHELLADPKERAEHAMLVDLARNDLGRVCVPGTRPAHAS